MIFERRAYTLRPGRLPAFWDAQTVWATEVFGPILKHNIGYFSAIDGRVDEVIHLYRFDTLDQWRTLYKEFYASQSPEYFALVRPWMVRQENMFFSPAPIEPLAAAWTGSRLRLPSGIGAVPAWQEACVVETTIAMRPGGLPTYWQACHAHRLNPDPVDGGHLLAELVSLAGRHHCILRYEVFASLTQAQADRDARSADPQWQAFVAAYSDWVADETTTTLRFSPLASRRALLRAEDATAD